MSNFTPGPWTFGLPKDATQGEGAYLVGPAFWQDSNKNTRFREADARLISAAPGLLMAAKRAEAALKSVIKNDGLGGTGGLDHPFYSIWHDLISAIEAAELEP